MSYILDALRKADAERERDPARGIHAQPLAAVSPRVAARRPYRVGLAVAAVLLVAGGAALWPREAPVAAAPAAMVPAPAPLAMPPQAPTPTPTAVAAPAPTIVPVAAAVSPPAPPPLPTPPERPVAKAAPAAAAVPEAPPAPAAAPPADRVFAVAELPADVQRALPKLAISGGVHSDNAAQRMLIVGGQVVAEGAELAPGVVLEQVRARTAVLRFRGYRYSVGY